jgi:hypothetical protein
MQRVYNDCLLDAEQGGRTASRRTDLCGIVER